MDFKKFFKALRARKGLVQVTHINGVKFPLTVTQFSSNGELLVRHLKKTVKGIDHLALYSHPTKRMTVGNTLVHDAATKKSRPATRADFQ